ncbi:MAG: ATP-binding protein [Peptostreptococcus sp.]|uniref:ATP-binding protein n=1 Tax=Peptostreptococcus sp. TaxID=1262 RepID=UPI001CB0FC39|nr:ATP-binding protein [Peptostreptococcus sp.]MBF1043968.1 ATP-binding protein [Peptostreptococcus sp.]MBF1050439.1 ATP-binding protein [Peptostreptococcus sp.]
MIIERKQYLDELIKKKDNGRIKIITGIRRCGKSYLLFELYKNYLLKNSIAENQIIEMALDDIENSQYRDPFKLNEYIKSKISDDKRYYIFIDEIQFSRSVKNPYIDDEDEKITFVDTLLSLMKRKNLDIYITGSNSKMLSKDILTQFRDRGDEIHLYPLSFAEMSSCYEDKDKAWEDYVLCGGMPFVLEMETFEEKSRYLKGLFEETYIKDIIDRNQIKNSEEVLEVLLDFVSSAVGSLTNPLKLSKRYDSEKKINISNNTISKYLIYFEEAYLLYSAKRYDIKGSKYFSTPLKYYFADIGLRNARLNFRQVEETHIMENIIYNDLLRRGFNVDVGVVEYFPSVEGKTTRVQLEVDFVINRGNLRYYIQSAFAINSEEKKEQERNSLKRIDDSFKKIIIVRDNIVPRYDEYGIYYVGIRDFLLRDDFLEA